MKINEVEAAVGVTKKNIRFYEEEGLISPSREPGNGYRSYSQADVERLRRIKLLRKLDVPLAEIREMLEGQRTLAEGMSQQLERLRSRRADLEEAIGFCTLLQQENGPLEQLDVEQTLARLTAREEQGVTFVNIERTDQKTRRIRGACIGAALFVAMMAFVMAIMGWAVYTDPQDAPPLPLLVVEPWVEQHLYNGCPTSRYPAADGRYRVRNAAGQFLGLANITGGVLRVEKLFVERN